MARRGVWAAGLLRGVDWLLGAALVGFVLCQLFVGFLPRTGEYRVARELTGSMRPTIPVGAMIIDRPLRADRLKDHEVISFHRAGELQTTTHRVISVRRDGGTILVRTRGDANNVADTQTITFGAQQRVWRTAAVVPTWISTIVFDVVNRGWRLLLSLLPMTLFVWWLRSRSRSGVQATGPRGRLIGFRGTR
jgi:signal peptidase I